MPAYPMTNNLKKKNENFLKSVFRMYPGVGMHQVKSNSWIYEIAMHHRVLLLDFPVWKRERKKEIQ
jgi:hypothetical protein